MQNIFASTQGGVEITDGAGYQGKFLGIWVASSGDIAISYDNGNTFVTRKSVPGGAFFNAAGNYIGTSAQGTTATGLVAEVWGPYA